MADIVNQKVPFYKDKTIDLVAESSWDQAKSIYPQLKQDIARVLDVAIDEVIVERPKDTAHGDYSCNIAMHLAKGLGQLPRDYAAAAVEKLKLDSALKSYISMVEVAGPGFINFTLSKDFILEKFKKNLRIDDYTNINILKGKRIMFEYAHPNPFKAFHIGHLRNIILGESLIRILEALGAEVIRVNYQGDVGMHIAKCLWAFQKIEEKDYPTDITERVSLIAKCYSEGATAFADETIQEEIKEINRKIYSKEDPQINKLWELGKQWSLDKFYELYKRVDSTFVRQYMESETLPFIDAEIEKGKQLGVLTMSDGALVLDGTQYGLDTRVYINSKGLPTYEGKQIGLVPNMEFKDYGKVDLLIFNVAVEQISFFRSTIKAIELIHPELKGKQYHNAYEFVGLKSGKMSSRTGNVVLGEDIINEAVKKIYAIVGEREGLDESAKNQIGEIVGVGAIKYSFLNINPGSYLAFDLDKSLSFDGNSGPYLQYTYARANKIVKDSKLDLQKELSSGEIDFEGFADLELSLVKKLLDFENVIIEAGKNLAPNIICTYLFELAQMFNGYYKNVQILKSENASSKVILTYKVATTIQKGLQLLGIKTNDYM